MKDTPMPGIDDSPNVPDANVGQSGELDNPEVDGDDLEIVVMDAMKNGRLGELLEFTLEVSLDAGAQEPGGEPRPGVEVAIDAFRAWKRTQGGVMATDQKRSRKGKPQTVPLAYAGKWVAWSADGLRILAVGDSFEDCEQKALEAGFQASQVTIDKIPKGRLGWDEDGE
jgi:hypothetical protein